VVPLIDLGSKLNTYLKQLSIPRVIKNICDSQEEVKVSTLTGICQSLIPPFIDDFVWLKTKTSTVLLFYG
jgi:hypothetical protein